MLKHEINLYQFSSESGMTLCKIEVERLPPECVVTLCKKLQVIFLSIFRLLTKVPAEFSVSIPNLVMIFHARFVRVATWYVILGSFFLVS